MLETRIPEVLGSAIIVSLLLTAAYRDVATRSIPDIVSILIAVCGLTNRLLIGPIALALSLVAGVCLFLLLLFAHAKGALGGGDVKLMAAFAFGLSLPDIWHFIFATALSGGVLAGIHLSLRRAFRELKPMKPPSRGAFGLRRLLVVERWRIARHGPLPYGVAITCGGIIVLSSRFQW